MPTHSVTTLTVQSVLFHNEPAAIERAARAIAVAAQHYLGATDTTDWSYRVGDCSAQPVLNAPAQKRVRALIEKAGGTFHYEFFAANLGSAEGHNRLAALGNETRLVILNPDAVLAPDTLGALALALEGERVGSVEARQVPLEHPKQYDPVSFETGWSSTACLMTTRAAFSAVGGFDSKNFFLYCDDVDYSWMLRLAGYRVLYAPWATLFHDKRLTVTGQWIASEAEHYYSALAAMVLAHKYGHPRRARQLERAFTRGNSLQVRAAAEFRRRRESGDLGLPISGGRKVAQFRKGLYAEHRF